MESTQEKLRRMDRQIQAVAAMIRAGVPAWEAWLLVERKNKEEKAK